MGIVLASHSMSLDGLIAQPDGKAVPLHEWLWTGDHPSRFGATPGVTHLRFRVVK